MTGSEGTFHLLRLRTRLAIVFGCTLAGVAWLIHTGPVPVIRIMTPLTETAPFWYMLSAFPILGMLVADLVTLFRTSGLSAPTLELGIQIALIVAVSNLRLGIRLPISGHALLVSYFILRRLFVPQADGSISKWELAFAFAIFGLIAYPKLAWWTDPITLGLGVMLAAILAAFSWWFTGFANSSRFGERTINGHRSPGSIQ